MVFVLDGLKMKKLNHWICRCVQSLDEPIQLVSINQDQSLTIQDEVPSQTCIHLHDDRPAEPLTSALLLLCAGS